MPRKPVVLLACVGLGLVGPPLGAQSAANAPATLIPFLGPAVIWDGDELESGGLNALVELALPRGPLRWIAFASVRGIGAACADGCDLSGKTVGLGLAYPLTHVDLGGGLGLMRRSGEWSLLPHVQVTWRRGALRARVRVEAPHETGDAYFPLLVGLALPLGG